MTDPFERMLDKAEAENGRLRDALAWIAECAEDDWHGGRSMQLKTIAAKARGALED